MRPDLSHIHICMLSQGQTKGCVGALLPGRAKLADCCQDAPVSAAHNANKRSGQAHSGANKPVRNDVQITLLSVKLKMHTLLNIRCIIGKQ